MSLKIRPLFAALAGLLAAGILTFAVTGCGDTTTTASTSAAGQMGTGAMSGMNHAQATTTHASSMHNQAGTGSNMGMTGLVPGADGTRSSAGGLTLKPQAAMFKPGMTMMWNLRVMDKDMMAVTRFERDQTKLMHLIVVRDDLSTFQHLHPTLGANGRFSVPMNLPMAGRYRAIADFTTAGKRYALGTTMMVPGSATAKPLPAPRAMSMADGYAVKVGHPSLMAGKEARVEFTVARGGKAVTGLQPYLGAFGHLVALHKGDLTYSHVHPAAHSAMSGTVSFAAEFPQAGTYRLFLQFRAGGAVHTAPFTVTVGK